MYFFVFWSKDDIPSHNDKVLCYTPCTDNFAGFTTEYFPSVRIPWEHFTAQKEFQTHMRKADSARHNKG